MLNTEILFLNFHRFHSHFFLSFFHRRLCSYIRSTYSFRINGICFCISILFFLISIVLLPSFSSFFYYGYNFWICSAILFNHFFLAFANHNHPNLFKSINVLRSHHVWPHGQYAVNGCIFKLVNKRWNHR